MASLCATYWRPLYAYVRRQGRSVEDAQDLTQSFFSFLLEKDSLRSVGSLSGPIPLVPPRIAQELHGGRMAPAARLEARRRLSGHCQLLEEMTRAEDCFSRSRHGAESRTPGTGLTRRNWALALLERTTSRLAAEFESGGRQRVFELLRPYLTGENDGTPYSRRLQGGLPLTKSRRALQCIACVGAFRTYCATKWPAPCPNPAIPAPSWRNCDTCFRYCSH